MPVTKKKAPSGVGKRGSVDRWVPGKTERRAGPSTDVNSVPVCGSAAPVIGPLYGLFVEGSIRSIKFRLLVDTGSTDTFLSMAVYHKIPNEHRPHLQECESKVRQVDGSLLKVYGSAWLELRIGKTVHPIKAVVADIGTPAMLGMDWLLQTGGNLDFGRLELCVNGERIRCTGSAGNHFAGRVVVAETTVIPAGQRAVWKPKPYKCLKCDKAFTQPKGLNRHRKYTHGPPVFLHCRICEYVDKRRDNLRRHYKTDHPEKVYEVTGIKAKPLVRDESGQDIAKPHEVRRVVKNNEDPPTGEVSQEAELVKKPFPLRWKMPLAVSPLHPSPSDEEEWDDDALSIVSSLPGLEIAVKEDEEQMEVQVEAMEEEPRPSSSSAEAPVASRPPSSLSVKAPEASRPRPVSPKASVTSKPRLSPVRAPVTAGRPIAPKNTPPTGPSGKSSPDPDQQPIRIRRLRPQCPEVATIVEHIKTRTYVRGVMIHEETRQRTYYQDVLVDCMRALETIKMQQQNNVGPRKPQSPPRNL